MASIDDRLLNQRTLDDQASESQAASQIKKDRRNDGGERRSAAPATNNSASLNTAAQLREQQNQARNQQASKKESGKDKMKEEAAKMGFNELMLWVDGAYIPSFLLSILVIDVILFIMLVWPELLKRKFSFTWKDIGYHNWVQIILLNLVTAAVYIGALAIFSAIVSWMTKSWWEKVKAIVAAFTAIMDLSWGAVVKLFKLFSKYFSG